MSAFCYEGDESTVDLGDLAPALSAPPSPDSSDALRARVLDLERQLDDVEDQSAKALETLREQLAETRADVYALEADREEMLDMLGLTETEWDLRRPFPSSQHLDAVARLTEPKPPPIPCGDAEVLPPIPGEEVPPPIPVEDWHVEDAEVPPPIPDEAESLVSAVTSSVTALVRVDPPALVPALVSSGISWNDEQVEALDRVDQWLDDTGGWDSVDDPDANFLSLTGPAGTGKSTLAREIVARHPDATLCATTGKAALRLSDVVGADASTLHRELYYPPAAGADLRFERLRDPPSRFVVVDESSMLGPTVYWHLRQWASLGVRILLVGDSYQLPPVVTGEEARRHGEDFTVFSIVRGPELRKVVRNAGGVLRAANRVRETGDIVRASDLDGPGRGYEFGRERNPAGRAIEEYLARPEDTLLITWKNSSRMGANAAIRARLGHGGPLPDEGGPLLVRKNGQGVMNGQIVVSKSFETGPVVGSMRTMWLTTADGDRLLVNVEGGPKDKGGCWMDGGMPWIEDWKKFHVDLRVKVLPEPIPITWGYCLTCHAGQGSQARRVVVFLDRGDESNRAFRKMTTLPDGAQAPFASRWAYTAQTRAVEHALFLVGR